MIRAARAEDMPRLIQMGRAFHRAHGCPWEFSEEGFADTLLGLLEQCVLISDDGLIAGALMKNPIATDWHIAKEFLWWANGSGLELKNGFRRWAKEAGADEIQWSCAPENDRVRRVYSRTASPSEIIYSEKVTCV